MDQKSSSPFTGLDKALLRSTQKQPSPADAELPEQPTTIPRPSRPRPKKAPTPSSAISLQDSEHASMSDSMLSHYQTDMGDMVAAIRKAVKLVGREVSFVRLTPEEKAQLSDIVYTYKRQGKRTSENEINRIAVNFILRDYKANGENSILARVIEALLA